MTSVPNRTPSRLAPAGRLTVGLIAPPWVPVPPPQYGGTELVIDVLARGLQAAGHRVRLFATGDSTCPVPRQWIYPRALGTDGRPPPELDHVRRAYEALDGRVDIIHDHTLWGPWLWAREPRSTPVVATVHGAFTEDTAPMYRAVSRLVPIVAISRSQAASCPGMAVAAVIHHGIDPGAFAAGPGDGGYVAFLGRMNPDKGPQRAIVAARRAGVPIRLAAKIWEPGEHRFFDQTIRPMLGHDAVYVGEVGPAEKACLLGRAIALLNPIRWPEPFGLVMVEAMACGTPVISFPEGAAPEIVDDGVTGFLCDGETAMAAAVASLGDIDRRACRAAVESRFSAGRMVDDHLRLYRKVLAGEIRRRGTATGASIRGTAAAG